MKLLYFILAHTVITAAPEDYEVVAGSMATFHCNAVADRSLKLDIDWLAKDEPINFESEPRFVKTNDYSMTITKTIELDSGTYTCLAKTNLDQATASATLTVQVCINYNSHRIFIKHFFHFRISQMHHNY